MYLMQYDILGINEEDCDCLKNDVSTDGSKLKDNDDINSSQKQPLKENVNIDKIKEDNVLRKAMTTNQMIKSSYKPYAIIYKEYFEEKSFETVASLKEFCYQNEEKTNLILMDHADLGDIDGTEMMTGSVRQLLDINNEKDSQLFNANLKEFKLNLVNLSKEKPSSLSINKS